MKTHRFDTFSFVSGLVAVAIGLLFLLPSQPGEIFDFIGEAGTWLLPAFLLTIGVAVLAPPLFRSRGEQENEDV
jgi:hypothetical protein